MAYIKFKIVWVLSYDDYQDDEHYSTEDEAIDAATQWSAMVDGDPITVSFIEDGKLYAHREVIA